MNPLTSPMMAKTASPVLTAILLTAVIGAFACVLYMLLRHQYRTRKAKKHNDSPHTGRHGNH